MIHNLRTISKNNRKKITTPVKQKHSHNTQTTQNIYLNTLAIKTFTANFTTENSNKLKTNLSNNTGKINLKPENEQVIRKISHIETQIIHNLRR